MEGRHRPSFDAVPRRRGHGPDGATLHRLHRPPDEVRRVHEESCSLLHDDLFDFFYEGLLPGLWQAMVDAVAFLLPPAGAPSTTPEHCDYTYKNMTAWGRKMFVTPGVVVDGRNWSLPTWSTSI